MESIPFFTEFQCLKSFIENRFCSPEKILSQSKKCCLAMKTFKEYLKNKGFRLTHKEFQMFSEENVVDDLIKIVPKDYLHDLLLEKMKIVLKNVSVKSEKNISNLKLRKSSDESLEQIQIQSQRTQSDESSEKSQKYSDESLKNQSQQEKSQIQSEESKNEIDDMIEFFRIHLKTFYTLLMVLNNATSNQVLFSFDQFRKLVRIGLDIISEDKSIIRLKGYLFDTILTLKSETSFQRTIKETFVETLKSKIIEKTPEKKRKEIENEIESVIKMKRLD